MTRLLMLMLVGCGTTISPEGNLVAVGDSIFEWNAEEDRSIPQVIAEARGQQADNRAISGSMVTEGEDNIPGQYIDGGWQWLVMDGGGNDVNGLCDCGDCEAVLDALVSADGSSGAVPDFITPIAATGTKVAIVGYGELREDAEYGFDRCGEELEVLSARYALLADSIEGVIFVDARDVISATDAAMFDEDMVHPSIEGSEAIGLYVAAAMTAAE
ncbi:MAG: acyl-CoA thioesterase-1 [Myxococcota bacterium]|jgi:acyl-CoA thioesterase-1